MHAPGTEAFANDRIYTSLRLMEVFLSNLKNNKERTICSEGCEGLRNVPASKWLFQNPKAIFMKQRCWQALTRWEMKS